MLLTVRVLVLTLLLLVLAPRLAIAATISLDVSWGDVGYTAASPGSIGCNSMNTGEDAQAAVTVDNSPFSVMVNASLGDFGSGGASYSATLQITITGGTGAGEYGLVSLIPLTVTGALVLL
jgi:hypothetical protein